MKSRSNDLPTGSASSRFYYLIWLALGAAGIFYVTVASLAPEALRGLQAASGIEATNAEVADLSTSVTQIKGRLNDIDTKQQAVANDLGAVRGDITTLKGKVGDMASLDQSFSTRLATLESNSAAGPEAKATTPGSPGAPTTTQAIAAKPDGADVKIDGVVVPPEPDAGAPVKVAAKAPDAKPKPYAVGLALSTSTDALRQIWQLFKDQHPDLLDGLSPRYTTSGSNVRLQAGPYPSQASAAAACAKMRSQGMTCTPTPLAGTPL